MLAAVVVGVGPIACGDGCKSDDVNVLLISIDTLRADRLNAYGYDAHEVSPHIDALAADGIVFENNMTASPWTTPAHMSLLTSLNPSAHGVTASFKALRKGVLGGAKYPRLAADETTLAEELAGANYATAAFTAGGTVDPSIGFNQGFDSYDTSMLKLADDNMAPLLRWLEERGDQSWFMFWHTFEVHAPYVRTRFLEGTLPASTIENLDAGLAEILSSIQERSPISGGVIRRHAATVELLKKHDAYTREVCELLYLGGIAWVDDWVGRLVAKLREEGLYDNTLIILTSDHGEEFGEHNPKAFYDRHGHTLYEELVHVPLIVKLPRQAQAGTRVSEVTRLIDVMPTILDVAGVTPTSTRMQGETLRPLWQWPRLAGERVALIEALAGSSEAKAMRSAKRKYIVSMPATVVRKHGRAHVPTPPDKEKLFDVERDPKERRNLLARKPKPAAADAKEARAMLSDLRRVLAERVGLPERGVVDAETIEQLKALGYIEE
jgi:arylsulfatase A-like enzyme